MKHLKTFESFVDINVNEGKWANIMKGVKSGSKSGPWTIVIIQDNKKVIDQILVNYQDAIPAAYEAAKRKHKNVSLVIEDNEGMIVYSEKI